MLIAVIVAAMVVALWLSLRRYSVRVEPADPLIDDLIRRKGAGADPLAPLR